MRQVQSSLFLLFFNFSIQMKITEYCDSRLAVRLRNCGNKLGEAEGSDSTANGAEGGHGQLP